MEIQQEEQKMKNSKNNKAALISGAFGMFLFMIGDWLLDAAGAGDTEIGLIAHSNWPQMAMWRFVLSATLAMIAIFPVYFASNTAIRLSCDLAGSGTRASRFWNHMFRLGHIILIVYGMGFHVILCLFPIIYKKIAGAGGDLSSAAETVNSAGSLLIIQLMLLYLICDLGVSIAWYYMVLKKEWKLGKWALLCCPFSTLLIDFALKSIPMQFFKDFTVSFESLGWLLMYLALAKHISAAEKSGKIISEGE